MNDNNHLFRKDFKRIFLFIIIKEKVQLHLPRKRGASNLYIYPTVFYRVTIRNILLSLNPFKGVNQSSKYCCAKREKTGIVEGRNLSQSKVSKRLSINLNHRASLYNKKKKKYTFTFYPSIVAHVFPFLSLTLVVIKFSEKSHDFSLPDNYKKEKKKFPPRSSIIENQSFRCTTSVPRQVKGHGITRILNAKQIFKRGVNRYERLAGDIPAQCRISNNAAVLVRFPTTWRLPKHRLLLLVADVQRATTHQRYCPCSILCLRPRSTKQMGRPTVSEITLPRYYYFPSPPFFLTGGEKVTR